MSLSQSVHQPESGSDSLLSKHHACTAFDDPVINTAENRWFSSHHALSQVNIASNLLRDDQQSFLRAFL